MVIHYTPDKMGSYAADDVVFLLRDLSHIQMEKSVEEREKNIQLGTMHYSEMLPIEYQPSEHYLKLYEEILEKNAKMVAENVAIVCEKLIASRELEHLVLVSLARAGTPIGILMKRYIETFHHKNVPHYSISIIRDRGIDETALRYIFTQHPNAVIQFVDGWTGKGAITKELGEAVAQWNDTHPEQLDASLAVLADPGHSAHFYGTQDDFLIPSACLNSTVSGLVSRTVLNEAFLEKGDFHGAKYYKELEPYDVSNAYLEAVTTYYTPQLKEAAQRVLQTETIRATPTWEGLKNIEAIQHAFHIQNIHHIKPGVGETTRVLLRRIPWKILVNPNTTQDLSHILLLAEQRGVAVEPYEEMTYACCGLIKDVVR